MEPTHKKQYPILVYGTLRKNQSNYSRILAGKTVSETVVSLSGFKMHSNGGFPYISFSDEENDEVVAEYMVINPTQYSEVMQSLDWLEGYRDEFSSNHYDRHLIDVTLPDFTKTKAWIYVVGRKRSKDLLRNLELVTSGDWLEFRSRHWSRYDKFHHTFA